MQKKYAVIRLSDGKVELAYSPPENTKQQTAWDNLSTHIHFELNDEEKLLDLSVHKYDQSGFILDNNLVIARQNQRWNQLRAIRDSYLKETDYTQIGDYNLGLTQAEITSYTNYRTYLRNLPDVIVNIDLEYNSCKSYEEWNV